MPKCLHYKISKCKVYLPQDLKPKNKKVKATPNRLISVPIKV